MIKLDLNVPIEALDGALVKDENSEPLMCCKIVANGLVSGTKGDSIKYYEWARKLYKGQALDLDKVDFKKIYDFVESSESVSILGKAQILNCMDECEKRSKEAEKPKE